MNLHTFPPLFLAISALLIANFIYYKKKFDPVIQKFVIFLLSVSLWNIDIFGIYTAPNEDFAEIWGKVFRNGLFLVPVTFYHFVITFVGRKKSQKKDRILLISFYVLMGFFAIINWTPYFTGEAIRYRWGYQISAGPLYIYFMISFLAIMVFTIFKIIQNYFESDFYQKQRIKYFFMATIISFLLGSVNFLPMFGKEIYPFGSIAVFVGLFIAAYSVVQNRLMDVSVFMAKGLGYFLSIVILAIPSFFIIYFLELFFFKRVETPFSLLMILLGIVAVLLFGRIKEWMDRSMHQIIVRDKYYYHRVLEEFSRRLVTIVDLNRLLNMLAETIEKSMGVEKISVFLYNSEKEIYYPALFRNSREAPVMDISFKSGEPFIKQLRKEKDAVLRVELERDQGSAEKGEMINNMGQLQAEVSLPLIYSDRLIGFINLGHKSAEEMYYREDINLLITLSNQVAIAIENANLYENLKKSQNILRRSDRLASLGTLIASLAHEIRNPLVSIKTFTQLLPERIDDTEFRDYFLKVASGEIDRLTSLINELLGFAKPSEPHLKGENINDIIDKMEVLIATEARKKNIAITKNYTPNLPKIMVDAEQIKQVLLNILLNATHAIVDKGDIWIETRIVNIFHEDKKEPYVQIEIRDSGVGIPADNIDHVFDPFFTTRPEGSGLGLAISHQIVHEHGGFIDIESEIGKGASFRIHFPLSPGGKGAFAK